MFTKTEPLSVLYGIGLAEVDAEGRVICAEYPDFYLVTVYTPNAQRELVRIDFRMAFEDAFRAYLEKLHKKKPVIVCGDMNVAHKMIDIKNAKANIGNAGFSYEERGKFSELLAAGFNDSFRMLYPDQTDAYSWWSYMGRRGKRTNLSASSSLTRMRTCGPNMRAIPFPTPASCTGPWPTWACRWCSSRCAT